MAGLGVWVPIESAQAILDEFGLHQAATTKIPGWGGIAFIPLEQRDGEKLKAVEKKYKAAISDIFKRVKAGLISPPKANDDKADWFTGCIVM